MDTQNKSPHPLFTLIIGRVVYQTLSEYIEGRITHTELLESCAPLPVQGSPKQVVGSIVGIVPRDVFETIPESNQLSRREVSFTVLPFDAERIARFELWPTRRLYPFLSSWDFEHHVFFEVIDAPPSVEVRIRLADRPYRRLLDCLDFAREPISLGIKEEIAMRLRQFGMFDSAFYFQDHESILAWNIASCWDSWEERGSSMSERRDEICQRWDNWERSAFLYELRARLLPECTWDIFEGPWFTLDASQRAVLFLLWPPDGTGEHYRSAQNGSHRTYSDTQQLSMEYEGLVPINSTESVSHQLAVIGKRIEALKEKAGYHTKILRGDVGSALPKKPDARKKTPWHLIEALDEDHVLNFRLSNKAIVTKRRQERIYEAACQEAGLPPYEPVRRST